jgi:anion-transporting  ArsA/GET3 family ATPase
VLLLLTGASGVGKSTCRIARARADVAADALAWVRAARSDP